MEKILQGQGQIFESETREDNCSGVMGVPITAVDKYNKEEWILEVIESHESDGGETCEPVAIHTFPTFELLDVVHDPEINGQQTFKRIFIRNIMFMIAKKIYKELQKFHMKQGDDIIFYLYRNTGEGGEKVENLEKDATACNPA